MLKTYLKLSKYRITLLVILTSFLGYLTSSYEKDFSFLTLLYLILGIYLVSSGSFVLNQAHESDIDNKMNRTKTRPIPQGKITIFQANIIGILLILSGLIILSFIHILAVLLSLITCLLYNFYYTLRWKQNFPFAAVILGAIPGAMPILIGYSAGSISIFSIECIYLFLILFLWQMPHFWALSLHYKNDYKKAHIPILPVYAGTEKTFFYIGLYMFPYLGIALLSPFFLNTGLLYLIVAFPLCLKIIIEFYLFYTQRNWLSFFSWINISLLVFLAMPFMDRLVDQWITSL